jgi:hypothetical protein
MDFSDAVKKAIDNATVEQLQNLYLNGVAYVHDQNVKEVIENEFHTQAAEKLKSLGVEPKKL